MSQKLQDALKDLKEKRNLIKQEVRGAIELLDLAVQNVSQYREQVDLYQDQIKSIKSAPVCSLSEYKEAIRQHVQAKNEVYRAEVRVEVDTENLLQAKSRLVDLDKQILEVEAELKKYGHLLEFPKSDDRGSDEADTRE